MNNDVKGWTVENAGSQKTERVKVAESFFGLLGSQSLMSINNNIVEVKDVKESIARQLETQRNTVSVVANSRIIPTMLDMSLEQSPHLPGIILFVEDGRDIYLMQTLFYKKGVTEALETLNMGNTATPPTFSKYAESFINAEMRSKVASAFTNYSGKKYRKVHIVSNYVIDIDQYIGSVKDHEVAIENITSAVLREWYNAMFNFTLMAAVSADVSIPNPFGESKKLLGNDRAAVARIDIPQYPLILDGKPSPANLMVKLATSGKNSIHSQNFGNIKSIATTYLNVSLELMSKDSYRAACAANNNGLTKGPLVPVISIGKTVPGEQFQNNDSILNAVLGIYAMLAANNPIFFTEAFRYPKVGSRGSLANLAKATYNVSGIVPPNNELLTPTSLADRDLVMRFMQTYISPRAVFVMDLPTYIDNPSNSEFWFNLANTGDASKHHYMTTFLTILNLLSDNGVKAYIDRNVNNPRTWNPNKPIMKPSSVIIPTGTASVDGQIISLEEVDHMFLRSPTYYADNELQINNYMSHINGSCQKDYRLRQLEIKRALDGLFSGNVSVTGWKHRWVFCDDFLNAIAESMTGAGNITVTSVTTTQAWESQVSNDYLTQISSAAINNNPTIATNMGYNYGTQVF